eukprot:16428393-Heterocapsa_arctica.AAC.1
MCKTNTAKCRKEGAVCYSPPNAAQRSLMRTVCYRPPNADAEKSRAEEGAVRYRAPRYAASARPKTHI